MSVDVFSDCHDHLFEVLEDSVPDAVMRDVAEESLHHIES
jgi:hypothetical protein